VVHEGWSKVFDMVIASERQRASALCGHLMQGLLYPMYDPTCGLAGIVCIEISALYGKISHGHPTSAQRLSTFHQTP